MKTICLSLLLFVITGTAYGFYEEHAEFSIGGKRSRLTIGTSRTYPTPMMTPMYPVVEGYGYGYPCPPPVYEYPAPPMVVAPYPYWVQPVRPMPVRPPHASVGLELIFGR